MKKLFLIATAIMLMTGPGFAADEPSNTAPAAQPADVPSAPPASIATPMTPATPPPAPTPGKFYLEVDQADLNALSAGINELPKKIADPLLLKLNGQLNPQVQATLKAQQEAATKSATAEKVPLPKPRPGKRD